MTNCFRIGFLWSQCFLTQTEIYTFTIQETYNPTDETRYFWKGGPYRNMVYLCHVPSVTSPSKEGSKRLSNVTKKMTDSKFWRL